MKKREISDARNPNTSKRMTFEKGAMLFLLLFQMFSSRFCSSFHLDTCSCQFSAFSSILWSFPQFATPLARFRVAVSQFHVFLQLFSCFSVLLLGSQF